MKLSIFTSLISAALVASVVAQSSGDCTCYGTPGRVRHLQKQDLFPQKNLVQQNDIKVADVEVTSRLRDVSPDDFDRAAMRVLQKASGKKGGKGDGGKKGGKKEGKKGGKKGETDDYFMIPEGDDKLDDLVEQYCSCQEVCDDYFVEPCIEEPVTGKKSGKGGKGGKGGKKGVSPDDKGGKGEKGGKAEKGTAKTSASSAFVNATEGVRSLQAAGKKGGKGGAGGKKGGKKVGKKGGKGGKKGELCPPGGKKGGKGGKKGGKKAGKKGVIDGGICRPVCTCQNYLTFAPATATPVPTTRLNTPEPTTPEPTTGPPVGEPSQKGEPTEEPSTAPPTTSAPTPVPPTTSAPTPVPPTTSAPTPVSPTTSRPTPAKDCIETCICQDGDQVTVNFEYPDALFDDWAGIYKCKKSEEDTYNYHPEAWLFTCYDGVCQGPPPTSGSLVFQEPFPEYTNYGPFSWPLVKGECYVALLSRNVGRSPPPYDLICVGEEFIF